MLVAVKTRLSGLLVAAILGVASLGVLVVAPAAPAQQQNSAQVKCLTGMAKGAARLVKAQGKEIDGCLYDLTFSGGNTATCLTADPKGKIAKATQKIITIETKRCGDLPDFGFVGADELISAAIAQRISLVEYSTSTSSWDNTHPPDPPGHTAACSRMYLKRATRILGRKLKFFSSCLKSGLADSSIQSAGDVVACLSQLDSSTNSKLGKMISKYEGKWANSQCETWAGLLWSGVVASQIDEADRGTSCRACELLRIGGALTVDCDLIDNGSVDFPFDRCIPSCGDGQVGASTPWAFGNEECDDGNRLSGDGCDSNCKVTMCGNGLTTSGEFCDADGGGVGALGGACVGGSYDGLPCTWNADCQGGYCTSCPERSLCESDCSACMVPVCTYDILYPGSCGLLTGLGETCGQGCEPFIACDDPFCGTQGNCTLDGYCVPTTAEKCAEYEGVSGSCILGF
ncbi:MAG TPA: DUF4215 domain-containing protein [Deltaproteobacteria bacterium]|nr:DUF4215 domain-containing protein [Deltaproteobacteria bacterium]